MSTLPIKLYDNIKYEKIPIKGIKLSEFRSLRLEYFRICIENIWFDIKLSFKFRKKYLYSLVTINSYYSFHGVSRSPSVLLLYLLKK